ncbi:hypothetical protein GHT06_017628 [Daphnia sinensis]|uniref:Ankyrin repeat domain-containing protein 40 n=1 Tax=Daphnia sinensis TaxID=1820382 RepID=A0AAD5L3L5_9CRUS|nr:hypothetical protein GHT06_017628 [Daphnia sinensis]
MESAKLDEEKLREAACYGDLEAVKTLLKKGVNINSQHSINGWTALHWAAKRNQLDVAHCLLTNGAEKNVESFAKETPADLSTSPAILNLLGSPLMRTKTEEAEQNTITPHYLAQSNTGYKVDTHEPTKLSLTLPNGSDLVKQKELVFKLRIAYSTDTDFIEVEIERSELNYQQFLIVCCSELGLNSKYVERLRKLPNTRLRKDRDVQRLKDFEEIEVVLVGSKPKFTIESDSQNIVGPALKNQNQTILY